MPAASTSGESARPRRPHSRPRQPTPCRPHLGAGSRPWAHRILRIELATPASQAATARHGSAGSPTADSRGQAARPAAAPVRISEVGPWIWMGRSSAGPPCAGASAAASRVAPGTPTTAPVGAGGSAPQAAPGPSGACGAVDAGGVAPRARGVRPGSRSPWPPPSGSRAGPARGCGAAPGRRTTTPHETSIGEGESEGRPAEQLAGSTQHRVQQLVADPKQDLHRSGHQEVDRPGPIGLVQHHPARWPLLFGGRLGQADSAHCGMPWKNDTRVRAPGPWRRPLPTGCRPTALRIASTVTSAPLQAEGPRVSGDGPPFASRLGGILIRDWSSLSLGPRSDSLRDPVTPNSPLSRTGTASGRGLQ
jgi:hypothetical protein